MSTLGDSVWLVLSMSVAFTFVVIFVKILTYSMEHSPS